MTAHRNEKDAIDSQTVILINHFMTKGQPLTVKSAIDLYGIYALSQRCSTLRKLEFPIMDQWRTKDTKHGKKRFKEYFM
jgi:hypothetical protein